MRTAPQLIGAVSQDGTLILSGILAVERDEVCAAFCDTRVMWEREEDGWVGVAVKKT